MHKILIIFDKLKIDKKLFKYQKFMTRLLFIIYLIVLNTFQINAQINVWPYTDYAYAKAYMYNLKSNLHGEYQIIKNDKIDKTAISDGILLTKEQTRKIIILSGKDVQGLNAGLSACFIPYHAIVFYSKKDKPVASVMFAFDCESMRLEPVKKTSKLNRELSENEIEEQLIILNEYEQLIKELGFPVLESPSTYRNYSKKIKRHEAHNLKLTGRTGVKQLKSVGNQRFDLSGIALYQNNVFVVADKKWNNRIYHVDTTFNAFTIKPIIPICTDDKIDFEGIDVCGEQIYLIEEWYDNAYKLNPDSCNLEKIELRWEDYGIYRSGWGNKGLEGIAVDCSNEILYLAKERQPRRLFEINLKSGEITEPFIETLGPQKAGHDISDMKFENGYLYILERGRGKVTRINIETKESLSFSFQNVVLNNGKRIFDNRNPEYGMAEALLLTEDQIWIGIDNNGDPVSLYGKTLGLKENNNTIILIFERPEGF